MWRVGAMVVAGVLLLGGCGSGGGSEGAQPGPSKGRDMTAGEVAEALKRSGLPIGKITVFTAANDPNGQLGRPGGYESKAACVDTRVPASKVNNKEAGAVEAGCGIETFPDQAAASARGQYIQQQLQQMNGMLGREYHYMRGGVLVRVTGHLTPDQAEGYRTALAKLP